MSVFGIRIQYYVNGTEETGPVFQTMAHAFERAGAEFARPGRYIFPRMQPVLEAAIARQIAAGGKGPARGKYALLSEPYATQKARRYPGAPINVASGALRSALTEPAGPHALRNVSDTAFEFGTTGIEYAEYVHLGTTRMPDRALFDFDDEFERESAQASLDGAREAIKRASADRFIDLPERAD